MSLFRSSFAPLTLALVPLVAPTAAGGELDRARVPAGAEWVMHADFEALTSSRLYRDAHDAGLLDDSGPGEYADLSAEVMRDLQRKADKGGELERLMLQHDFDPLHDFRSMTMFGSIAQHDDAVVAFELGPKAQGILDDLRAKPEHLSVLHGDFTLDTWLEDGNEVRGYLYAQPPREDGSVFVAVCEEREPLVRAARVWAGEARSLAQPTTGADATGARLQARPGTGSMLFVEVAGGLPGLERAHHSSRVFSSARSMRLDVGEQDGLFLAQLTVQTDDAKEARRVAQVIQGVVALASLASQDEDEARALGELADGVDVYAQDATLIADFEIESLRLVEMGKESRARRELRRQEREERREARRAK